MKQSLIIKAYCFARNKHRAQKRKYTGDRYVVHPVEVAKDVRRVGGSIFQICAALLHDTLEDTDATLDEIRALFGEEIATLVEMLTDVSKPTDGNRATRKEKDRNHLAKASPEAKTIKLADLKSNTKSITQHDKEFAKIYLKEKALVMEILTEGNSTLYNEVRNILNSAVRELKPQTPFKI